jgi:hypothetical protein
MRTGTRHLAAGGQQDSAPHLPAGDPAWHRTLKWPAAGWVRPFATGAQKKVQELNLSGCEFGENFLCKGGSRVSNANVGGSDQKQPHL